MQRTVFTDPYYYKQPSMTFIDELKTPLHNEKPLHYGKRAMEQGEVDLKGIYIAEKFEDDNGLLDTSYRDFELFLKVYEIGGNRVPVRLVKAETEMFEAYSVEIKQDEIIISANDTEGIRRGLVYLEDLLRESEAAFLNPQKITRKPFVKSRITRCFFSPINRAPKFGDELTDDIDYYPEEYLNRLMHEGVNGVWIYSRYSDLVPSDIIKEYGKGYEARIEKLNRVIAKCKRYGIYVYLFAIEPIALRPELAEKYPDMIGERVADGNYSLCCSSEMGKAYCYEAGKKLLELSPELKGLISITFGERPSSCASNIGGPYPSNGEYRTCQCPRCKDKPNGVILAETLEALRSGAREVNPEFETVSWTYGHRIWANDDIMEYVDNAPEDVVLMQNFDDMGKQEQLGKIRCGEDYWLSYTGPCELFTNTAERARKQNKRMFAKMQVCCSHEIASVPFVPVPGILFDKYDGAYQYGVSGIMQCWYFGNYPSLMSKAAGELSFTHDFSDKAAFLEYLAGIYYGKSKAKQVVEAWQNFEAGYKNYPFNIFFSYYGPMHDGVVWDLSLLPKNFEPPRSWQLTDPVDGDRICDTLFSGHTLEEAFILCDRMRTAWKNGVKQLCEIEVDYAETKTQLHVAQAIGLLFDSGANILDFYLNRDLLGKKCGNLNELLENMRQLVKAEQKNSADMIPLCEACGSLGYHSEAEGYKFFPLKLRDRIERLDTLLATEFEEVEDRIAEGKSPLAYYDGVEDNPYVSRYNLVKGNIDSAEWENFGDRNRFRLSYDDEKLYAELQSERDIIFKFCPEFELTRAKVPALFDKNGIMPVDVTAYLFFQIDGEKKEEEYGIYRNTQTFEEEGTHLLLALNLEEIGLNPMRPFKLKVQAGSETWCDEPEREKAPEIMPKGRLGRFSVASVEYGWILPTER